MIEFLLSLARDKKKLAFAGIAMAVFLYVDLAFIAGAQTGALKALNKKISQIRADISDLTKDIEYVRQKKDPSASQAGAKKLVQEKDIPALLQHISGLANSNGLRVMQIDSIKETQKTQKSAKKTPKTKAGAKTVSVEPKPSLPAIKIKMEVIGTYHKLGYFINDLENSDKFCFIDELMIGRDPADQLKQRINLVIKTYVKK